MKHLSAVVRIHLEHLQIYFLRVEEERENLQFSCKSDVISNNVCK